MPLFTAINSWQIPDDIDAPNIETAIEPLALAVDKTVVPRFATVSARNNAITSPLVAQLAWCSDTAELYEWNGVAWVSFYGRTKFRTSDLSVTSSTSVPDTQLSFFMEGNSQYLIKYNYLVSAASLASLQLHDPTIPSGTTGWGQFWCLNHNDGTSGDVNFRANHIGDWEDPFYSVNTGPVLYRFNCYMTTLSNSGSITHNFSKESGGNLTLYKGSWACARKVA